MKSNSIIQVVFLLLISMIIIGCSGSSDSGDTTQSNSKTTETGTFTDAPVKGLKYVTATQSGYTNEKGEFKYMAGEDIEFYVGDLIIGKVKASKNITPYSCGGGSKENPTQTTITIARILQTCDNQQSDTSVIDVEKFKEYKFENKNLDRILSNAEYTKFANHTGSSVVSKDDAISSMNDYLENVGINIDTFVAPTITSAQKEEFLNAVNRARATSQDCGTYGVKPATHALTWSDELYKAAYIYNYDMDEGGAWSHVGSGGEFDIVAMDKSLGNGSVLKDRVEYFNYEWSTIGENIAKGQTDVAEVIASWIDSDGHCINLMNPAFTEIGMSLLVGTATRTTTSNGVTTTTEIEIPYNYWTQDFGTPKASSAPVTPIPAGNENYTIFVYGSDSCGWTRKMRKELTDANIPFTYKSLYDANGNIIDSVRNEMWKKVRAASWYEGGSVGFAVVDVYYDGASHTFTRPSLEDDIKPLIGL